MIQPLETLVQELSRLPSIGRKSAWRLAMHILDKSEDDANRLADAIKSLKKEVVHCSLCYGYSSLEECEICSSQTRDHKTICIVEKPFDIFTFEKSGLYRGVYHVLGGVISPINGITPDKLRIAELKSRVEETNPKELILGLGGSSESETTASYLSKILGHSGVTISRLARGLPAGSDLEYVDQITLDRALNERTDIYRPS